MGKAPTLLQDDQLVYTCQFVKEGDGKAFITNVETQEIIELERRSTMPPNLQTQVMTCWAENDSKKLQQLPDEVANQIILGCEDFAKHGKPVIRPLEFSYLSPTNILVIQEPNKPLVLDCTDVYKVITRNIEIKLTTTESSNIFELLTPPYHLAEKNIHYSMEKISVESAYY